MLEGVRPPIFYFYVYPAFVPLISTYNLPILNVSLSKEATDFGTVWESCKKVYTTSLLSARWNGTFKPWWTITP